MPFIDGAVIGDYSSEIFAVLNTSITKTTKTGGTVGMNTPATLAKMNEGVTKIGPKIGLYAPEMAMILGGQELL